MTELEYTLWHWHCRLQLRHLNCHILWPSGAFEAQDCGPMCHISLVVLSSWMLVSSSCIEQLLLRTANWCPTLPPQGGGATQPREACLWFSMCEPQAPLLWDRDRRAFASILVQHTGWNAKHRHSDIQWMIWHGNVFTRDQKPGVISKGVFSLEESLEPLNKNAKLSRRSDPLFATIWEFSRISKISRFSRISRKWTFLKRPLFQKRFTGWIACWFGAKNSRPTIRVRSKQESHTHRELQSCLVAPSP